MGRKRKTADSGQSAYVDKDDASGPSMVIEGKEAVDLYARRITFNLSEMEKQVELLRDACLRTKKLLRDVK